MSKEGIFAQRIQEMSDELTIKLTDEQLKEWGNSPITQPTYKCKKHGEADSWFMIGDKNYCLKCMVGDLEPMEVRE